MSERYGIDLNLENPATHYNIHTFIHTYIHTYTENLGIDVLAVVNAAVHKDERLQRLLPVVSGGRVVACMFVCTYAWVFACKYVRSMCVDE